jgi:hypothetical protein
MFNTSTTITIGLRTASGKTDIEVRWPSDEEWAAHRKRRKILQRQLGRGATETDVDTSDGDQKLYEAIKLNGSPPLSVAEAGKIVETIGYCEVLDVRLHAEDAEVDLQTLMGPTRHTVRIPTMDQIRTLQRSSHIVTLPYNLQEIRTNLESPAWLWNECRGSAEGYEGPVPAVHKDVAIRAVISAMEREAMPKYDEGNF